MFKHTFQSQYRSFDRLIKRIKNDFRRDRRCKGEVKVATQVAACLGTYGYAL